MFRQEALDAQHAGGLGEIVLIRPVSFTFLTLLAAAMALLVVGFFLFGSYTKRSTVSGQLVPASGQVKVHAPRAGIVLRKFVQEGQAVRRGERLMVLSSERYGSDAGPVQAGISRRLEQRRDSLRDELEKLRRLQDDERDSLTSKVASLQRELTTLAAQTDSQRRLLALASDAAARYQGLMDKGLHLHGPVAAAPGRAARPAPDPARPGARTHVAAAAVDRAPQRTRRAFRAPGQPARGNPPPAQRGGAGPGRKRSQAHLAGHRAGERHRHRRARRSRADRRQLASAAEHRSRRHPLQAELYAPSKSIGFIRPGDAVLIRYQAYPYQKFGQYHGKVQSISRASVSYAELSSMVGGVPGLGQDGEQLYRLRVTLDDQAVTAYGQPRPLQSGMLLDADILQDTRRLYEWVLEPLYSLTGKL
ncbi:HlyD family efflux transporter periplasmic adaptor subunit [Pseudomonas aeruginosa]|nr:HlyD family efflux transporter periplasmic adaptor subunit [Pseudomonas aeruginosa]